MDNFCVLSGILIEKCFLGILSIQRKIRRDRPTDTRRSTCWPPLVYIILLTNVFSPSAHFLAPEIQSFVLSIYLHTNFIEAWNARDR